MIQQIIRSTRGYVKIRIQGYSPERFLNLCRHHQIYIWGLLPESQVSARDAMGEKLREEESFPGAYEMYMTLEGFRKLKPIVKKTHTKVTLVKRFGLPFFLHRHRRRPVFAASMLLCAGLLFLYSTCIWDIRFEGNEKWTDETLLEFLQTNSVAPGMKIRDVDCAQIVKDIRRKYNDIVWVSASIEGSLLRIRVKENEDTFLEETKEPEKAEEPVERNTAENGSVRAEEATDLVASCDGVITSMITRKGVPQVHVGDTVKKGDLLVTGQIEVLNDAGEVINYQYQKSDADIYANTQINYEDTIPAVYQKKQYEKGKEKRSWYVRLGNLLFSFGRTAKKEENQELHTWETQLKLGENFYLPIFYGSKIRKTYTATEKKYSQKELQEQLSKNFTLFSQELEEKGIQIYQNDVKIHVDQKTATARGTLFLNQKITETAATKIQEIERNEQDESGGTDN